MSVGARVEQGGSQAGTCPCGARPAKAAGCLEYTNGGWENSGGATCYKAGSWYTLRWEAAGGPPHRRSKIETAGVVGRKERPEERVAAAAAGMWAALSEDGAESMLCEAIVGRRWWYTGHVGHADGGGVPPAAQPQASEEGVTATG
jgi:hypothetical protein